MTIFEKQCPQCNKIYLSPYKIKRKFCSVVCSKRFEYDIHMLDYKWRLGKLLGMAKHRANKQNIPFDITIDDLIYLWDKNNGCCELTKTPFNLRPPSNGNSCNWDAPSVDKIKPSLGYVRGNIRLICYQVNMSLGEYGQEQLYNLCRALLQNEVAFK